MKPHEWIAAYPDIKLRGLREITGIRPGTTDIDTGKCCPTCGERIYRTAADTNNPTCLSGRCAELRGKIDTITGHDDAADLKVRQQSALSEIMARTGLKIHPDRWAHWRPTRVTPGEIAGLGYAICHATDGNIAWFERAAGAKHTATDSNPAPTAASSQFFFGHTHRFTWQDGEGAFHTGTPPSLFAKDKIKAVRVKKKTRLEKLQELFDQI